MNVNLRDIRLVPNLISTFRLFLAIPIAVIFFNYSRITNANYLVVSLILIAFLSDILDGFIARRMNQISELGKIIDPFADKLLTGIIILSMWYHNYFTTLFIFVIIGRDVLILFSGIYLSTRLGRVIASDFVGKVTVFSIGIFILYKLIAISMLSILEHLLFWIVICLSLISLINYFIRGLKLLKNNGHI